jgi:hypothetical protein
MANTITTAIVINVRSDVAGFLSSGTSGTTTGSMSGQLSWLSSSRMYDMLHIPESSSGDSFNIFYSADNPLNENFTIVVLPDTQGYTKDYPWLFDNQTQWILDNKEALNIVFVTQLGDLVNSYGNITQWENANCSMSKLDGNVRWGVLPGNHDGFYGVPNDLTNYDNYFGYQRFSDKSWYGGAYKTGDKANSYQLFSAGGDDYLFHIQYNPSDDVLFWASNVIDQYPDSRVIVSTHDYIRGPYNPDRRSDIGERIWYSLIKQHADQIFLVLCGHAGTQSSITDTVNGHVVYQPLSDYQNETNIESGWLRILEFCPAQDKISVKTYSPYLNEYKTDPQSEFTLDYSMTGASIAVFSNFAVSQLVFDQSSSQISFEVSGTTAAVGYCNVTVPKALLKGEPWTVTVDDEICSYTSSENATHSSIYFICTYQSTFQVVIKGTWVIPEFPSFPLLPLFMIVTLLAVIVYRKNVKSKH